MSPQERDAVIRSVLWSEALAGVHVPREVAERLLDEVLAEPLLEIESDKAGDHQRVTYWWPFGWVWCWWKHGAHDWGEGHVCLRCGQDAFKVKAVTE